MMNNPPQPDPVKEVSWVVNPAPAEPPSGSISLYLIALFFVFATFIWGVNDARSPMLDPINLATQEKNNYRTVNTIDMFPDVQASGMPSWEDFLQIYRLDGYWQNRTYANYHTNIDPESVTGNELKQPIPREKELKIFFAEKGN